MKEQDKVDVIREKPYSTLVAERSGGMYLLKYRVPDAVRKANPDVKEPTDTLPLSDADLDALALWWLKKNPRLLAGLLSPQEKEALEWALSRANPDARFDSGRYRKPLQSILDRFKEGG